VFSDESDLEIIQVIEMSDVGDGESSSVNDESFEINNVPLLS
jgi:hypothetical protein